MANRHLSKTWWEPDPTDEMDEMRRAGALIDETASIETRQSAWHELGLWNSMLYTNRVLPGFRWGAIDASEELWPVNLRTENLIESIGEAMLSKASASPVKPTPVPHGKSWKTERAVRIIDYFLMGVWRQAHAEDTCALMFRDAYMVGTGCVHIDFSAKSKALSVNRVFFDNIIIDNRECVNGVMPRVYRIREVSPRSVVESAYGIDLGRDTERYHVDRQVADGWVVLVKAWRLPDANGDGGRYTIACNGKLLVDIEWKYTWVPLVYFHWQDRASGFFPKGGVEQVLPYQLRQNDLNDDISESQDIACRPRILHHAGGQIDLAQWDNKAGRIAQYTGVEPKPFVWSTNLQELYAERERNAQKAYSAMGISEMFAGADLAPGVRLDSSAGVREFRNMEDARHLRLWTNFEQARLRVAQTIIDVLSIHQEADAFTAVYHPGNKASARSIPFKAIKTLARDKYSWTLEATPLSQMSPAARRELLRDYTSRGLIDPDSAEARRLLGNPNLEMIEDLELAAKDDIMRHIDLLENEEYEAPTELTNCTLGTKLVTANYHRLKGYEDIEENDPILQNHIKWIVTAVSIQQAAVAPQPPPIAFSPTQGMPGTNATTLPPPSPAYAGQ